MIEITEATLLNIYLAGIETGMGTALSSWAQDLSQEQVAEILRAMHRRMLNDPLCIAEFGIHVREIVLGKETGPIRFTLPPEGQNT